MNSIDSSGSTRRFLTPAEVARLVGVSATTVTRWAREGKLPCQVTLGGHRRFDPSVVDDLRKGLRVAETGSGAEPAGPEAELPAGRGTR